MQIQISRVDQWINSMKANDSWSNMIQLLPDIVKNVLHILVFATSCVEKPNVSIPL